MEGLNIIYLILWLLLALSFSVFATSVYDDLTYQPILKDDPNIPNEVVINQDVISSLNNIYLNSTTEFSVCLEGYENKGQITITGFDRLRYGNSTSVKPMACPESIYIGNFHSHPGHNQHFSLTDLIHSEEVFEYKNIKIFMMMYNTSKFTYFKEKGYSINSLEVMI